MKEQPSLLDNLSNLSRLNIGSHFRIDHDEGEALLVNELIEGAHLLIVWVTEEETVKAESLN